MTGVIPLYKPQDFTSFDAVAKLRGILRTKKIGHGGTLDPMATGVLPIFIGAATRAVDLLPEQPKRYEATARFGIKTDTGDVTGEVIEQNEARCKREQLEQAMRQFLGRIEQIPPMYSAIKIGGRKLYDIARSGKSVERKPRQIEILSLELAAFSDNEFSFAVECSKGTYVRTLAEDIAAAAGCLASLSALQRTKCAGFGLDDCLCFEQLEHAVRENRLDELMLPVESLFTTYDAILIDQHTATRAKNGVPFDSFGFSDDALLRVYCGTEFLGLGLPAGSEQRKLKQFTEATVQQIV